MGPFPQDRGLLMEQNQQPNIPQQPQGQVEVPDEQQQLLVALLRKTKEVCSAVSVNPESHLGSTVLMELRQIHQTFKSERLQREFQDRIGRGSPAMPQMGGPGLYGRL